MSQWPVIFGLWLAWAAAALRGAVDIERALEHALNHNPDARIARQRIAAAQAGLERANAAVWPRLQFQSSYTRTDNPMMVFGSILNQRAYPSAGLNFNDVPDADDLNTRGLVTVPLYAGGKIKAGREAAKANTEAARQENEAVRNALGFEVSRGFYSVLKTRQFIRAAEAAVNSFETNLSIAQKRLEGGTLLKSDVLDLEVRLAQAREDLVRARNANALAGRALRNLLGIEEGDFEVADSAPRVTAPGLGRLLPARRVGRRPAARTRGRRSRSAAPRAVTCRASAPSAASITITDRSSRAAAAATPRARCSNGMSGMAN